MRRGTLAAADALRHEEIDLAFGILTGITLSPGLGTTRCRPGPAACSCRAGTGSPTGPPW